MNYCTDLLYGRGLALDPPAIVNPFSALAASDTTAFISAEGFTHFASDFFLGLM